MKGLILFVVALAMGLVSAAPADAAVLFPRLALSRQRVVVQQQAVVAPLVVRQRFVAPVVVPHVQQFVVPYQVQQLRVQQFVAPLGVQSGCGAYLVR